MEKAKTERVKQLLSSYYGPPAAAGSAVGQSQQQSADGSAAGMGSGRVSTGGVISLDSPAFNPDRHIAHMIQTYSVDRLMAEHKGMAKEIKNLDSDMQQLVYENYNKFIAATDTIRSMKSNVDSMETDIDQLRSNMDTLVERSSSVNAKLLKRRQHIEELNRVQGLLLKLQAVFDLPSRMQAALEEDALDSAVSFYAEALPVLRKYGHKGAFRGVAVQADAAAKQISTALKRRLAERKDETEHVVLLLRQLGEGDDTLQEKYLQGRKERMQRILQEASAVADAMAAAAQAPAYRSRGGSSDSGTAALPGVEDAASWGVGADGRAPALSTFVKALDERLINAIMETVMNMSTIFLQDDRTAARRKPLVVLVKEIISQYFKLIRRAVSDASMSAVATAACLHLAGGDKDFRITAPSLSFSEAWGADVVMQAMSAVTTDIGLLHSQLPELSLRDLAAAATEQAVQGHINAAFAALQERLNTGVGMLCQQLSTQQPDLDLQAQVQPLMPAYSYLSDVVQRGTAALLKGLRVYEQYRLLAAWQDRLSDAIQAQMSAVFSSTCSSFLRLAGVKEGSGAGHRDDAAGRQAGAGSAIGQPNTGLVLVLAKLCVHMETMTVPHIVEVLANAFQGSGSTGSDGPPRFVGGEVARRLGTIANLLLTTYVELHGSKLSMLVQQSMAGNDWQSMPAPAAPQPVCDQLLQCLARAEAEVARLLDNTGRQQGGHVEGGSHHQRGGSMGDVLLESGAVERGVAKLFRGKVTPFGSSGLRFTQSAALSAIAIVGLKSLLEHIRLITLAKEGLQQLQLDVCYLRHKLLQLVGGADAEPVAQVLDDVVGAAAERSTDPTLLDAAAIETALAAARVKGQAFS